MLPSVDKVAHDSQSELQARKLIIANSILTPFSSTKYTDFERKISESSERPVLITDTMSTREWIFLIVLNPMVNRRIAPTRAPKIQDKINLKQRHGRRKNGRKRLVKFSSYG
jgi:hypothetical protein